MYQKRSLYRVLGALLILTVVGYPRGQEQKKTDDLPPGKHVLWMDPGDPSTRDFHNGAGGVEHRPQPPFHFVSEDLSGTTPKVNVRDSRNAMWNVKWGEETRSSVFCTRLLWACGYYVSPEYFIKSGQIEDVHGLKRAKSNVARDGSFQDARFQLRSDSPKYLKGQSWTWRKNPFTGTHELNGLKILMLLVSNWDAKDARNYATESSGRAQMDSNLAIFLDDSRDVPQYLYLDDDWGATMGRWGHYFTRSKWDCKGFASQSTSFLKVDHDASLDWGFDGKHRSDLAEDIRVADVQWLLKYLGRITDEQIRSGLGASGATPSEMDCYTESLRSRIEQLRQIAGTSKYTLEPR